MASLDSSCAGCMFAAWNYDGACLVISNALHLQISMSVPLITVVVTRSVPTQWGHFSVAAAMATHSPMMKKLVRTSMSALLALITASSAASIQQGDLDVNVMQDSD